MGLFDKFKKKDTVNWSNAYVGQPSFYNKSDGTVFGAFALTENTLSSMPKNPKWQYKIDGKEIGEWKVCFISTTKNSMIGDIDYYSFLNKVKEFIIDENNASVLIRELSLNEMQNILQQ